MKTTDIFNKPNSKKLNETLEKTFGQKLDLESFDLGKLHDVRNKLRTHIYQVKQSSNFNETIENEAVTKAQWILDTVNAEIACREEVEPVVQEADESSDKDEDDDCMDTDESVEENDQTGDDMNGQIKESATDKASAIVTAKTMVDRVSRWVEELSGMENDTLLTLGDSIRDEMGQEQAKAFLSAVAPAIQQALENLKQTRETLASGVRSLTGEAQPAELIGAEPEMPEEPTDMAEPADPDAMNTGLDDLVGDEFDAAEPAAGPDAAGRAKRESIDRSNNLLKVLAG
jgi:septal ring factor EnvC (AmiA/AmiB activator)